MDEEAFGDGDGDILDSTCEAGAIMKSWSVIKSGPLKARTGGTICQYQWLGSGIETWS